MQNVEQYFAQLRDRAAELAKQRNIDLAKPFDSRILPIKDFSDIFEFWDRRPDRSSGEKLQNSLSAEDYLDSFEKQPLMLLLHA